MLIFLALRDFRVVFLVRHSSLASRNATANVGIVLECKVPWVLVSWKCSLVVWDTGPQEAAFRGRIIQVRCSPSAMLPILAWLLTLEPRKLE